MANPILSDNFPARPVLEQRKPDANPQRSLERTVEKNTQPRDDDADVGRAHQRLSQESGDVREPTVISVREASQRAALIKDLMGESPNAGLKAHGNITVGAFEAAMARPAA